MICLHRDRLRCLRKSVHATVRMQYRRALLHCLQQQAVQVGAVQRDIGRAITRCHGVAQRQFAQYSACHSTLYLQALRAVAAGPQGVEQTPVLKQTRGVGAELDARTHFAEGGCFFKQLNLLPRAGQKKSRRQSAYAATGYRYLHAQAASNCRST